jgi:hypothetical protein
MIRTGLAAEEATAVAAWLAAAATPVWSEAARAAAAIPLSAAPEHLAAGEALYRRLACATCHARGPDRATTAPAVAAPDLAFVAVRMQPAMAAAVIADPEMARPTRMPRYPISAVEAARLRDFLWASAVSARAPAPPPVDVPLLPLLPLLARPVRYEEVRRQVLDRICIHCHMDPRRNGGDGGPGNTGGLGYRGAGLDLESWAGIQRGARDASGRRVPILRAPAPGEDAPLVARLRLRQSEHARELAGPAAVSAGGPPGMPLGLPPLTPEELRLVRSWVAQGAPGPLKIARAADEGPIR